MINVTAAAAKLGVNPEHIRALLVQRRIPGAQFIGRQWLVPEDFVVIPGTRGPEPRKTRHEQK
jgi:excisionase family DNA binding protein